MSAVLVLSALLSGGILFAESSPVVGPMFNEIKVRADTNNLLDVDEFIEIINPYTQDLDLNAYSLEYFNATNPTAAQQPSQKPIADGVITAGSHLVLAKQPAQIPFSMQSPFSSLSDTGGRLRLVTAEGDIVDEIAWTNASSLATAAGVAPAVMYQCNSSSALCAANRIQSFGRQLAADNTFVLTAPAWLLGQPSPISAELLPVPVDESDDNDDTPDENEGPVDNAPQITCEGIVITEIMPNPEGTDTTHEFIELFNPTDEAISLEGCVLQVSSSTKTHAFGDVLLQPNTFLVLSDTKSGLTLPNGAGGTVWLLTPADEIQAITYPADMEDDTSLSYINGHWETSYTVTPGQANISQPTKPCPAGQVRDTTTNRCVTLVSTAVATLTPCKVGQERNPETNRCRTVVTAASLLVPCKPGQTRNPETNRCRSADTEELTPCAEGQERNPETNRCRKISSVSGATLAAVTDVETPMREGPSARWWLAGLAVLFAVGYGVYEWRQDLGQLVRSTASRLTRSK